MRQLTVLSLRWPYAVMAMLTAGPLAGPMVFPLILHFFAPGVPSLKGDDLLALYVLATPLFISWACFTVIPIVRPRRLTFTEQGVTLDTVWRRQHWPWDRIVGIWPLGGYKLFLQVGLDNELKRIFLGSYWPGESAGLASVLSQYRATADRGA